MADLLLLLLSHINQEIIYQLYTRESVLEFMQF